MKNQLQNQPPPKKTQIGEALSHHSMVNLQVEYKAINQIIENIPGLV